MIVRVCKNKLLSSQHYYPYNNCTYLHYITPSDCNNTSTKFRWVRKQLSRRDLKEDSTVSVGHIRFSVLFGKSEAGT